MASDSKKPSEESEGDDYDGDEDIFYDCQEEISHDCDQEAHPSPGGAGATQKRKAVEIETEKGSINLTPKKPRKSSASQIDLEISHPAPNRALPDRTVEFGRGTNSLDTSIAAPLEYPNSERHKNDQLRDATPEPETCFLFVTGKTCKRGEKCKKLHDVEQRESYLAKQKVKAENRLRYDQKAETGSTPEQTEPQFGILVSGFGEMYGEGSVKVFNSFKAFRPGRVKWSSQFSVEEREKLQDRYSLPEIFVRMGFSTAADQRNAITQRNGRTIGSYGPRALVQRYIPGSALITEGNENVKTSGGIGQQLIMTKADELHKRIQDAEEERNRNYRLGLIRELHDPMPAWMLRGYENGERELEGDEDYAMESADEDLQLLSKDTADLSSFAKIDCSGMSVYD